MSMRRPSLPTSLVILASFFVAGPVAAYEPLNPSQQLGQVRFLQIVILFGMELTRWNVDRDPSPRPIPFQLSPDEQQAVDRLLHDWQSSNAQVQTFQAEFTRWTYDEIFRDSNHPETVNGTLYYAAPDKGLMALDNTTDKWIFTGATVFEFVAALRQVREYRLPPRMATATISDGPMPFIYDIDAKRLKSRYWLRIATPPQLQANQVWLEAHPKRAEDAAYFSKVDVILNFSLREERATKLELYGLQVTSPNGKQRTSYLFRNLQTNSLPANPELLLGVFYPPIIPPGWRHQLVDLQAPTEPKPPQTVEPPRSRRCLCLPRRCDSMPSRQCLRTRLGLRQKCRVLRCS